MSLQAAADVPLLISSPNSSSERRISPSWSIAVLKARLEPITGIPAGSQQLTLRLGSQDAVPITAADEEHAQLSAFALQPYAEIIVSPRLDFIFCAALPASPWAAPWFAV
jgi:tubulin-folding cofactor B